MAVIAIDFDGTLVNGDKAIEGAKESVNMLREQGHKILIYSCNNLSWIKKVLANNDIRYDWVYGDSEWTKGKPLADLYVDDKGYQFKGDWNIAYAEITDLMEGKDNRKW